MSSPPASRSQAALIVCLDLLGKSQLALQQARAPRGIHDHRAAVEQSLSIWLNVTVWSSSPS